MGNLSQIVSFSSDFSQLFCEFHTFFQHFPLGTFGTFSHFPHFPPFSPISPHFPTFFSVFPFFPFSFTSAASWLIRLQLLPTPAGA